MAEAAAATRPSASRVRVLQSFPHRIGAARICTTAWQEAAGASAAGADVLVMAGSVARPLPEAIEVCTTLSRGRARLPYRALGRVRALRLHDRLVARALPRLADRVDLVHGWPLGSLETLRAARSLGIPTVLERPNAHTRFAYAVVAAECRRLGVRLPPGHEHAHDDEVLAIEEAEYALADRLLCPSDFVARTFLDRGFSGARLARHQYGFDDATFRPGPEPGREALVLLFVGVCAVRKGVHFALEAWLRSPASESGRFLIAGEFLPGYAQRLAALLDHPSVEVLGHRTDVPELMRSADALVLPSIEEGSALVCSEAMASGCIPLVSTNAGAMCRHGVEGLVHDVGDVAGLAEHLTLLHSDAATRRRMRAACIAGSPRLTWTEAGRRLVEVYEEVVAQCGAQSALAA